MFVSSVRIALCLVFDDEMDVHAETETTRGSLGAKALLRRRVHADGVSEPALMTAITRSCIWWIREPSVSRKNHSRWQLATCKHDLHVPVVAPVLLRPQNLAANRNPVNPNLYDHPLLLFGRVKFTEKISATTPIYLPNIV